MYVTENGDRVLVIDGHVHLWDARPDNRRNRYGFTFIESFWGSHVGMTPAAQRWDFERFLHYGVDGAIQDLFVDGYCDAAVMQPDLSARFLRQRLQHRRAERGTARCTPRPDHPERPVRSPRRHRRPGEVGGRTRPLVLQGRQAIHRRVERRVSRLHDARRHRGTLHGAVPETRHPQHPRAQGPDHPPAEQGFVRCARHRLRGDRISRSELHRRSLRHPADRRFLLDRRAGAERLRRTGTDPLIHPRPATLLRQHARGFCCSSSARTGSSSAPTTPSPARNGSSRNSWRSSSTTRPHRKPATS